MRETMLLGALERDLLKRIANVILNSAIFAILVGSVWQGSIISNMTYTASNITDSIENQTDIIKGEFKHLEDLQFQEFNAMMDVLKLNHKEIMQSLLIRTQEIVHEIEQSAYETQGILNKMLKEQKAQTGELGGINAEVTTSAAQLVMIHQQFANFLTRLTAQENRDIERNSLLTKIAEEAAIPLTEKLNKQVQSVEVGTFDGADNTLDACIYDPLGAGPIECAGFELLGGTMDGLLWK